MRKVHAIFLLLFATWAFLGAGAESQALTVPECDVIVKWAREYQPGETWQVAPEIQLPIIFRADRSQAVFGKPALAFDRQEIGDLRRAVNTCAGAAQRRKDLETRNQLRHLNNLLAHDLSRAITSIDRAQSGVREALEQLQALPETSAKQQAVSSLIQSLKTGDTAPLAARFPQQVSYPIRKLSRFLPYLPSQEAAEMARQLKDKQGSVLAEATRTVSEQIANAPDTPEGMVAIRRALFDLRENYGDSVSPELLSQISRQAEERLSAIRNRALAEQQEGQSATIVPPTCVDLYRWGASEEGNGFVTLPSGSFRKVFTDERVLPVFHKSVGRWNEKDVSIYKSASQLCDEEWRGDVGSSAQLNRPSAGESDLVTWARRGRWIVGDERSLNQARSVLESYNRSLAELAALEKEVRAVEASEEGMKKLQSYERAPILQTVTPEDRTPFMRLVASKKREVSEILARERREREAVMLQEELDALKGSRTDQLKDLGALWKQREKSLSRLRTAGALEATREYDKVYKEDFGQAADRLLPEFKKDLARIPETAEGMKLARKLPEEATGIAQASRALPAYEKAAQLRAQDIAVELERVRCEKKLNTLDVSTSDSRHPLWLSSDNKTTLGQFICAVVDRGHEIAAYEGPGFFSGVHTLRMKLKTGGESEVLELKDQDFASEGKMLVGIKMTKDGMETDLSTAEWEAAAEALLSRAAERDFVVAGIKLGESTAKVEGLLVSRGMRKFGEVWVEQVPNARVRVIYQDFNGQVWKLFSAVEGINDAITAGLQNSIEEFGKPDEEHTVEDPSLGTGRVMVYHGDRNHADATLSMRIWDNVITWDLASEGVREEAVAEQKRAVERCNELANKPTAQLTTNDRIELLGCMGQLLQMK
jgi:hypothetical protein